MASNAFNLANVALTSSSSSNATIVTFTGNLQAQSLEVQGSNYIPPNGIYLPSANTLAFATASTNRLNINAGGNVGIGTVTISAGNALAVFGGNIQVGTTGNGVTFADGTYQSTAYTGAIAASGTLIRAPRVLESGTSYTTPSNCTSIYVEMVGGGGGGTAGINGLYGSGGSGGGRNNAAGDKGGGSGGAGMIRIWEYT